LLDALYVAGFETRPLGETGEMRKNTRVYVPGLKEAVAEISPFYALRRGRGRPERSLSHETEDFTIHLLDCGESIKHAQAQKIIHMLYLDCVWTDFGRLKD
jgi:hypothetical protein